MIRLKRAWHVLTGQRTIEDEAVSFALAVLQHLQDARPRVMESKEDLLRVIAIEAAYRDLVRVDANGNVRVSSHVKYLASVTAVSEKVVE